MGAYSAYPCRFLSLFQVLASLTFPVPLHLWWRWAGTRAAADTSSHNEGYSATPTPELNCALRHVCFAQMEHADCLWCPEWCAMLFCVIVLKVPQK